MHLLSILSLAAAELRMRSRSSSSISGTSPMRMGFPYLIIFPLRGSGSGQSFPCLLQGADPHQAASPL